MDPKVIILEGREVLFLSGFFGIIAVVIFGSGRRNTTGSPFRWARGPVAIGFLLLAFAVLTAACGSSSDGDGAPGAGAGTAASSGGPAVPPAPTGTSEEVAKQELDILIQLSQAELILAGHHRFSLLSAPQSDPLGARRPTQTTLTRGARPGSF